MPDADNVSTRALLQEFAERLGRRVGVALVAQVERAPEFLAGALADGQVQLAWVSPSLVVLSERLSNVLPLVRSVRQGVAAYHGALFVEEGSAITSALDLKGKRAAWVAETSASGYLYPRLALANLGLDARELFSEEQFLGSHGEVARAVFAGEADVGATYAVFENADPSRSLLRAAYFDVVPGKEGRILLPTAAIPSDLIVAVPGVDPALRDRLRDELVRMSVDEVAMAPVREVLGAEAFEPADIAVLAPLREHIFYGRQLGVI